MARVELPESRLRLRKRKRRLWMLVVVCVLVLLALIGLVAAAYIPAVRVQTVSVVGAQTLASSTIEAFVRERLAGAYGYVLPKNNIFLYPKARIRTELLVQYPVLAGADVHAGDFTTVVVQVAERIPRALWCPSDGSGTARCLFLDEYGAAYGEAPVFSEPVYTVYRGTLAGDGLPKYFLSPEDFQALAALVDAVVQKLSGEELADVSVTADRDVSMRFLSGFMLRFALGDEGGDIFERLALALEAEPFVSRTLANFEYLDLRFGDKLYYKLR